MGSSFEMLSKMGGIGSGSGGGPVMGVHHYKRNPSGTNMGLLSSTT